MSGEDFNLDDTKNDRQSTESIGKTIKRKNHNSEFSSDFFTGFRFLIAIGFIFFLIIPLFNIGLAIAAPIVILFAFIILIALFGRIIKFLKNFW